MKLYFEILKLVFRKLVLRQNTGAAVRKFSEKMGVTYIKFAQILATQNLGQIFTEEDRQELMSICDDCVPVEFTVIEEILREEYGEKLETYFAKIEPKPVGAASISQVHRATLRSGETVAIKVKRQDIARTLERDVETLQKIIHRYGRLVKFKNFLGGDVALKLYLGWLKEEIDFAHERENIEIYRRFAENVNGKVRHTKKIKVPKVYNELCTENVLVMEFIECPTINQMELSEPNKRKVVEGINSYIQASFWALFHDEQLVYHGDPHGGNIYFEEDGSIGFLDMGLIFVITPEEGKLLKQFFLAAYARDSEKIYEMLLPYGKMSEKEKQRFREEIEKYCVEVKRKDVTAYFMEILTICLGYQFVPPDFLFRMAKAFVCLNGISGFTGNLTTAPELLQPQVLEYLMSRGISDCYDLVKCGVGALPRILNDGLRYGIQGGMKRGVGEMESLCQQMKLVLTNCEEALALFRVGSMD